jgi:transcriptional regulator GlxA family with amidase domain
MIYSELEAYTPDRVNRPDNSLDFAPATIVALVSSGFLLSDLAILLDYARATNELLGSEQIRVVPASVASDRVQSSCGLAIPVVRIKSTLLSRRAILAILGDEAFADQLDPETAALIRTAHRHGSAVWAIGAGVFALAVCGLLSGRRCAVHWKYRQALTERFADLTLSTEPVEHWHNIVTCIGGSATRELATRFIADEFGVSASAYVRSLIESNPCRENGYGIALPAGAALRRAIHVIDANNPLLLPPSSIAAAAGVSVRQLERLFRRHLGATPSQFCMELSLRRARQLLRMTSMSICEVALACGFGSASHFARRYRRRYGATPRCDRHPGARLFYPQLGAAEE